MRLSDFTGLGRAIDPHYPTNRAIAFIVGAVAFVWAVGTDDIGQGLRAGVDVFFAWALCRELDPDHDLSAFLAVALMLAGLALSGVSTGPLFWLLLVVRVVNRTTGLSATMVDATLVVYLGVTTGWGVATATAFALDALLAHGRRRHWRRLALFLSSYSWGRLTSVDDTTQEPLDLLRVRCAQLLALGIGTLGGLQAFLPLWAAVAAASLWNFSLRCGAPTAGTRVQRSKAQRVWEPEAQPLILSEES